MNDYPLPDPNAHGNTAEERLPHSKERGIEQFLEQPQDAYAIFQLKNNEGTRDYYFESMARLQKRGLSVENKHYDLIYTAHLPSEPTATTQDYLNDLYQKFNIAHPAEFTGHSLSISDVIVLKQAGEISCHYIDSFGFSKLPSFLHSDNPLRNAEMAMEDDYGMIDGILNNGKSPALVESEKPSILDQLKTPSASKERPSKNQAEQER